MGDRLQTYAAVEQLLKKHHYRQLSRHHKGLLRRLLGKVSGFSRARLTRLMSRYLQGEAVAPVPYRRHRFARRYQRAARTFRIACGDWLWPQRHALNRNLSEIRTVQERKNGPAESP